MDRSACYIHACIVSIYTHIQPTRRVKANLLHIDPCWVGQVEFLVRPRSPPLDLHHATLLQAQRAVAVMDGLAWLVAAKVALCTVAVGRKTRNVQVHEQVQDSSDTRTHTRTHTHMREYAHTYTHSHTHTQS